MDKLNSTRERKMQVYPEQLRLNLRVLPGNAKRWSELGIENRLDFTTEWANQMFDLEDTARQYKRGELPAREAEEFLSLLGAVRDAMPTARRLNLHVPDIPDELYPKSPLREAM